VSFAIYAHLDRLDLQLNPGRLGMKKAAIFICISLIVLVSLFTCGCGTPQLSEEQGLTELKKAKQQISLLGYEVGDIFKSGAPLEYRASKIKEAVNKYIEIGASTKEMEKMTTEELGELTKTEENPNILERRLVALSARATLVPEKNRIIISSKTGSTTYDTNKLPDYIKQAASKYRDSLMCFYALAAFEEDLWDYTKDGTLIYQGVPAAMFITTPYASELKLMPGNDTVTGKSTFEYNGKNISPEDIELLLVQKAVDAAKEGDTILEKQK
jgi:hypothetical protein